MPYDTNTSPTEQEQGQQAYEIGFNTAKAGVLSILEQRKTILSSGCLNRFMEVVECEKLVAALVPRTGKNFSAGSGDLSLAVCRMLEQRLNDIARYSCPADQLAEIKFLDNLLIDNIEF